MQRLTIMLNIIRRVVGRFAFALALFATTSIDAIAQNEVPPSIYIEGRRWDYTQQKAADFLRLRKYRQDIAPDDNALFPAPFPNSIVRLTKGIERKINKSAFAAGSHFQIVASDCSGYGAQSAPDGMIELCRGTFKFAESADEIAFQACHEFSHFLLGDLQRQSGIKRPIISYAADEELAADMLGIDICASIGYDPFEAAIAIEKIEAPKVNFSALRSNVYESNDLRLSIAKRYLRSHYARGRSAAVHDLPAYKTDGRWLSMVEQYDTLSVLLQHVLETPVITSQFCGDSYTQIPKLGAGLNYGRNWIEFVATWGLWCGQHKIAAELLEPATRTEHLHGNMLLLQSSFWYLEYFNERIDGRDGRYALNKALQLWDRSLDPHLWRGQSMAGIAVHTWALSGGDVRSYRRLKQRVREKCRNTWQWERQPVCQTNNEVQGLIEAFGTDLGYGDILIHTAIIYGFAHDVMAVRYRRHGRQLRGITDLNSMRSSLNSLYTDALPEFKNTSVVSDPSGVTSHQVPAPIWSPDDADFRKISNHLHRKLQRIDLSGLSAEP